VPHLRIATETRKQAQFHFACELKFADKSIWLGSLQAALDEAVYWAVQAMSILGHLSNKGRHFYVKVHS
jgi:hypothetical protein